jgi:DNA uptake protein ComE-like DNA-binding protein
MLLHYLKTIVRNYFGFSQKETNASVIIMFAMLLTALFPFVLDAAWQPDFKAIQQKDQQKLDSLLVILIENEAIADTKKVAVNPNEADSVELIQAGFPHWLIQRVISYRTKVKPFQVKADLQKVYGMKSTIYEKIAPYLLLPDSLPISELQKLPPNKNSSVVKTTIKPFDLNEADTTQLKQIRGIGSKLAIRIVKYRQQLGGFVDKQQLNEIYGLSPEVVQNLQDVTYIQEDFQPTTIAIHQATFKELNNHPYISYEATKRIFNYTKKQKITSWETLEELIGDRLPTYWKSYFILGDKM